MTELEAQLADYVALQISQIGALEERLESVDNASRGKDHKLARQKADLARLYEENQKLRTKLEEKVPSTQQKLPIDQAVRDAKWAHQLNIMRLKEIAYDIREKMIGVTFNSEAWNSLADQLKSIVKAIASLQKT